MHRLVLDFPVTMTTSQQSWVGGRGSLNRKKNMTFPVLFRVVCASDVKSHDASSMPKNREVKSGCRF